MESCRCTNNQTVSQSKDSKGLGSMGQITRSEWFDFS